MKKIFLCAVFFLCAKTFSQLTGIVLDSTSSEGLEYATVAVFKSENQELVAGVVTDIDGTFSIPNLKKGNYYVEASFIGYITKVIQNVTISVNRQTLNLGKMELVPSQLFLKEVEVTGEKSAVINKIDRRVFSAESYASAKGGSATDVLRNIPSITMNGVGELSVRGSTGFVLLLDGKPIQGDVTSLLDQLPANAIESVELMTAPSAKYDPEGKAGILNIKTKKGAYEGDFVQVNIKGGFPSIEDYNNKEYAHRHGVDFTYNIKRDKWNISLGANYQRNDISGRREGDVFTILNDTLTQFPSDGERSFDETNYSGRFTFEFKPDTLNNYSLAFYAGKRSKDRTADILYFDNHAITPAEGGNRIYTNQYFNENLRMRKSDFVLGSFDYTHQFKNEGQISASLLYEYTLLGGPTTNRNLGFPNTGIVLQDEFNTNENPLNGFRFQTDYVFPDFKIGKLEVGYQYRDLDHTGDFVYERRNSNTGDFELVPEFSSEVDLRRKIHSGYAQLSGKKSKWDYSFGVRMEAMDRDFDLKDKIGVIDTTYVYDFVKPFPSASFQYSAKNGLKLKGAYSKRIERTTTFKMNPFPEREHSETLEQGDPTLLPEFIDLVEFGVNKKFGNRNSFFATAYYRNTKNVVNRVNTIFNDTILNRIYSNVGNGKTLGMDMGFELKPTTKWINFIGGNVYHYAISGSFDNRPVDTNSWIYSINTNSTYRFNPNTQLQFTFNYLSPRNTAQGEDSRFFSPNLSFEKSFLDDRLTATLQWQHIDMGLWNTNEQRITTSRPDEFFTTTNYVYEVDVVLLNLSYSINNSKNKSRFIESEFGKREF
nr:outer membrane beta-barrel protein [uncultured Allomuricauda sp.]